MYKLPETTNKKQEKAIMSDSDNIAVIAIPGSGKTFCLQQRVARLIDDGVDPQKILAITFTNKAAKELQTRINNSLVNAMTFHSLAYRICTWHYGKLTVLDEDDVTQVAKLLEITCPDYMKPLEYLSIFALDDPSVLPDRKADIARYDDYLAKSKSIDFDRMIDSAINVLKVRTDIPWKTNIDYILIDEYQDIDIYQQQMVDLLYNGKLFVIGDPDQCIYESFRRATPSFLLNFKSNYRQAEMVDLDVNYRSGGVVLNSSARFLTKFGRSVVLNPSTLERNNLGSVSYIETADDEDQALSIASSIIRAKEHGLNYNDVAIMFRTVASVAKLEPTLVKHKIPYRIRLGIALSERVLIKVIVALYRLKYNKKDLAAWERLVNSGLECLKGVGIKSVLKYLAGDTVSAKCKKLFEFETSFIDTLPDSGDLVTPIRNIITNITEPVVDLVSGFTNAEEFIETMSMSSAESETNTNKDAVILTTMHGAKGLEWSDVHIVDVYTDNIPHIRNEIVDEEIRLFYVALTRAKENVFIYRPRMIFRFGQTIATDESVFVKILKESKAINNNTQYTTTGTKEINKTSGGVAGVKDRGRKLTIAELKSIWAVCRSKKFPNDVIKHAISVTEEKLNSGAISGNPVGYAITIATKKIDEKIKANIVESKQIVDSIGIEKKLKPTPLPEELQDGDW